MKKFICMAVVLWVLLLGSVSVFADPSPAPDDEIYTIVKPPILMSIPR